MSIIVTEPTVSRGKKDAKRHREKQRDIIKNRLPEIISDEAIITGKGKKIIKIPIKAIEIPTFRPKTGRKKGFGQGPGKPGDTIGRRPGQGCPGSAGQEPGVDYLETEVDLEELIEMMLEDLGLPRLEDKQIKEFIVQLGWKIAGITKQGPWILLDKQRTAKEGMRKFWFMLRALQKETGENELICFRALKQAKGNVRDALEILRKKELSETAEKIEAFPIFSSDDLRFREIKESFERQSNAVVIAEMDVSGSMTTMKKYLARSALFWLVNFLRKIYSRVEIRFIVHHTEAKAVDEEKFFKTGESGGTFCYSAHELARSLIETEYSPQSWNIYVWHFSDGDDFNPSRTCDEIGKLLDLGINMFGYGEIGQEEMAWAQGSLASIGRSMLWDTIRNRFSLSESDYRKDDLLMMTSNKTPILGVRIEKREHLLPALKEFLRKKRWEVSR